MPHSATCRRRPTRPEVNARIGKVLEWIAAGADRGDIVRLSAETWGIRSRQADNYIAAAHRRLDRTLEKRITFIVNRQVYQLHQLYGRALAAGDLRAALKVLNQEAELLGLYPAPCKMTDEELKEALARVLEEMTGAAPPLPASVPPLAPLPASTPPASPGARQDVPTPQDDPIPAPSP